MANPRREAKKFANTVTLHRPYYYAATYNWVTGPMTLLGEVVFKKRHFIDGEPMAGPHSASWYWLNRGPLTDNRGARGFKDIPTLTEFSEDWRKWCEDFENNGQMNALAAQVARDTGFHLAR